MRYFPERAKLGRQRNSNERYRAYLLAQCADALAPTPETAETLEKALADVLAFQKPVCFQGDNNQLVSMEKAYQKLTFAMAESGCPNPDTLTVYQFYGWQEALEDKYKPVITPPDAPKR